MKHLATFLTTLLIAVSGAEAKPLKVFILAGQSNMQGHATIETFDYIGDDPATAPMLKEMRDADGKPRVCENVWISYLTDEGNGSAGRFGKLTAGYGADRGKIGPEFTFGIYISKGYDGPILIIKTAWGGKSLNTDFRSPSAGPYQFREDQLAAWKTQGQDIEAIKAEKVKATGVYYRLMSEHVKKVLADPKRVCPAYDEKAGYEIAGFVWFQGWNDMCDGTTYPKAHESGGYAEYTRLMAHFIRDVRKEFSAPDMRFVIGVIGVDGDKATGGIANLRPAMAAPPEMPEFKGNVFAVETAPFWDHAMSALMSKKALVDFRLGSAYVLDKEGVKEARDPGTPGWEPIGTPRPEDRVWRFTSFDPQNEKDQLPKTEKKRFRNVALPEGLAQWQSPEFDDSKWNRGKAPIGLGVWKHYLVGNTAVKYNSDWGKGEFLLMRTTFEVDNLEYESFRLSILAPQGFDVYLNGHKIHTYIWWKEPFYRPIELTPEETKHLRKGVNVLAAYANVEYEGRVTEPYAAIDLFIEGITAGGKKIVDSAEYKSRQMDKVCTRQEQRIIGGASNGGYHYLGSAKILGQIGKAFADAMLETKSNTNSAVRPHVPSTPSLPPVRSLFDHPMRDPSICLGPDGTYYLTGTTANNTGGPDDTNSWWWVNEGIRIWKSRDLAQWEPLGLVWSLEKDATWAREFKPPGSTKRQRAVWAPEIHYLKGTFWLAYSMNYGGCGLLKSTSGKAAGPYVDVKKDGPLTGQIDASLFQDPDGKVYWVYQDGKIARMTDDMTGLAEKPRLLKPANDAHVGFEGAFLTKCDGKYILTCAGFVGSRYNCMSAVSTNIYGPYGDRYLAIPHGGHNMLFKRKDGQWMSTFFGTDSEAIFMERPAILPIEINPDGHIRPLMRTAALNTESEGSKTNAAP